jgi:hypothetical protein
MRPEDREQVRRLVKAAEAESITIAPGSITVAPVSASQPLTGDELAAIKARKVDWSGSRHDVTKVLCEIAEDVPRLVAEVERLRAQVERVEAAVADYPEPCPEVDVDAGITCGWKRAFNDVRAALGS